MTPADKPQFLAVLSRAFRVLRQPVPEPEILDVWWTKLESHPIEAVAQAFSRHIDVSEFAPTPAAILKHLPKQSDGRPDAEEAWAISRNANDEGETVVWTQECAEAFGLAGPVLNGGDEVGARMAFKAVYNRLVDQAQAAGTPVRWFASLGHDLQRRDFAVAQAVRAGRLQLSFAQTVSPLLLENLREENAMVEVQKLTAKLTRKLTS
jgi:hypothetical protein